MLDRIHMFIPFKIDVISFLGDIARSPTLCVDLEKLGVPMAARGVLPDGQGGYIVEDLKHAWESLPSSYTPLAVKVFHQSLGKRSNPGVELKASPAKLLQGHNVFGPTSIRKGAEVMLKWLAGSYPKLWAVLDWQSIEVYALDCTYSARLPNKHTAYQMIQALRGVSNGQMRISVNVTGHFASNVIDLFTSVARGLKCNRIGHDAAVSSSFFRRNDSPFITIR